MKEHDIVAEDHLVALKLRIDFVLLCTCVQITFGSKKLAALIQGRLAIKGRRVFKETR